MTRIQTNPSSAIPDPCSYLNQNCQDFRTYHVFTLYRLDMSIQVVDSRRSRSGFGNLDYNMPTPLQGETQGCKHRIWQPNWGLKFKCCEKRAAGLTQGQLAELAEVSASFIGYVERAQQVPSLKIVERIAYGLKLPPKVLFDFAETENDERKHLYEALLAELTCTLDDLRALIQVAKQLESKLLDQQPEETEG